MKKNLLYFFCLVGLLGFAQTETYTINWGFDSIPFPEEESNGATADQDTSLIVEVGDTVTWDWNVDAGFHNVKSEAGSTETFGTPGGEFDTFQQPYTYSYTFAQVGTNTFVCTPHSPIMYGVIEVVPEGTLSLNEAEDKISFGIFPNPGKDVMNVSFDSNVSEAKLEVYDILGKRIYVNSLNQLNNQINITSWNSGVYLVKITSENVSQTKRFVKH
jgi:plastocyanin